MMLGRLLLILFFLLLMAAPARASSKVELYLQGAVVSEEVEIPPGVSEYKLELPYNVPFGSVRVFPQGFSVDSLSFTNVYLSDDEVPAIKELKDEIERLEREKEKLLERKKVIEASLGILKTLLEKVQMDSPSDAHAWISLGEERTTKYISELSDVERGIGELDKKINLLKKKLGEIDTPDSRRKVFAYLKLSGNEKSGKLLYSYYSSQAGWSPSYKLTLKPSERKIGIEVYANIWQKTGRDWRDVQLTLASVRKGISLSPPEEQSLVVDIVEKGAVKGRARAEYMALPSVEEERASFKEAELGVKIDLKRISFVPSTGERQRTLVWSGELPIEGLFYLCRAYVDTSVYRMASFKLSSPFDLLPGKAELWVKETFVGSMEIDGMSRGGVYDISFGSDERIEVQRKPTKFGETSKGVINKASVREYAYDIRVKNLTAENINLLVEEAYPVPMDSRIKVELVSVSPKEKERTETGHIKWSLELKSGEEKTLSLSYRIVYPQEEDIELRWR